MKYPIKLSPAVVQYIKKKDLVYVGRGNADNPLFPNNDIPNLAVYEGEPTPEGMRYNDGKVFSFHYFVSRADAAKHFPHCLPKVRKTPPKLRYFIPAKKSVEFIMAYGTHDGRTGGGKSYGYDGRYVRPLGSIEGVMSCVADGSWREVSKTVALARVKPPKTELELTKEALAAANARISELESKIASAQRALS